MYQPPSNWPIATFLISQLRSADGSRRASSTRKVLASSRNHILNSLSAEDRGLLSANLEALELPFRYSLETPGRPIEHVYFIDDGVISVVTTGSRNHQIEVGIIGRDGVSAPSVILGTDSSPNALYMQIPGRGVRIAVADLRLAMNQSPSLRQTLSTSVQAFFVQASYTALANGRARLDARLARWLVMAHDRLDGDRVPLTHEFLAMMLGVRRPGVSVELQKFVAMGLIDMERSAITIKARKALEDLADGFYGIPETEQERLTGWRPPHRYRATDS